VSTSDYTQREAAGPEPVHTSVRGYSGNGIAHDEERYMLGRRHDAANGSAAVRKWCSDGTPRHELHYRDGRREQ
jgi:hypothetical protein